MTEPVEDLSYWKARCAENTRKIGTLNARIDELTAKPEESKLVEARCPDCGGACARRRNLDHFECPGEDCQWRGAGHEVWRRWGDTEKADGIHWVKWSDDRRVRAVNVAYHNLDDTHWVLGPLPEPHAPGGE